jgi:cell division protein FtsB
MDLLFFGFSFRQLLSSANVWYAEAAMTTSTARPGAAPRRHNPRLWILLGVLLCGLLVAGYRERIDRLEAVRQQQGELMQQIELAQQRSASLRRELQRVQDPYFLALRAREEMGLAPEGEQPIVLFDAAPPPLPPAAAQEAAPAAETEPFWQQWWKLLFPDS